jgi:hypothetical protein
MGLVEAADSGDRLAALRELRGLLARSIFGADSSRDVAALSRQLTEVLEQIAGLEKAAEPVRGTPLDELRARRRDRGAGAVGGERPST